MRDRKIKGILLSLCQKKNYVVLIKLNQVGLNSLMYFNVEEEPRTRNTVFIIQFVGLQIICSFGALWPVFTYVFILCSFDALNGYIHNLSPFLRFSVWKDQH